MSRLIIMRGLTGAGKTTLVKVLWPDAVVCSADLYFERRQGAWDPHRLGEAHDECFNCFDKALGNNAPLVVVDNTNIKREHFLDYAVEGLAAEYSVLFFHVMCDPKIAANRSKHRRFIIRNGLAHMYRQHELLIQNPQVPGTESIYLSPWSVRE